MQRLCALLVALFLVPAPASAQDSLTVPSEPPEWGEVSSSTLRVRNYPADSNASAVILAEHGEGRFTQELKYEIDRHIRIKILDEGGYESGTVVVPFYAADDIQNVEDVEGVTYTLEEGTVRKHELDDDDIFEEDVDGDFKQIRFTLPNLEPGAVIEYRYELESENLVQIPGWSFQHAQPTLYSEYEILVPSYLEYVALTRGRQDYDAVTTDRKQLGTRVQISKHWVMKDVPALREEPYMTTPEDYRARLQLQGKLIRNPNTGQVIERFMTSWADLAETLLEADYFGKGLGDGGGGLFGGEGAIEAEVARLTDGAPTDSAKMHAIYDFVQSSIEWNGTTSRGRSQDFEEVLETQTGNSAEVNLLLVSLLQNAGLEAHPVLLSTRSHGRVYPGHPIFRQFNTVIASVSLPGRQERVLLDATEPLLPAGVLPKRDLNQQAWLVRKGNPSWIGVPPQAQKQRRIFVRGALQADGTLEGTITVNDEGYEALQTRQALQDADPSTVIGDRILGHLTGDSLSGASAKNREAVQQPMEVTADLRSTTYGQAAGGMLYMNPRVADPMQENPLDAKDRTFPVDFAYPRKTTYVLSLQIPESYAVKDLPQNRKVKLANNEGMFTRYVQSRQGTVMVRSILEIRSPRIPPSQYGNLREFFAQVVASQSEQLVLEKRTAESAASPSVEGK